LKYECERWADEFLKANYNNYEALTNFIFDLVFEELHIVKRKDFKPSPTPNPYHLYDLATDIFELIILNRIQKLINDDKKFDTDNIPTYEIITLFELKAEELGDAITKQVLEFGTIENLIKNFN
jgi:hypothetical protein